MEIDQRLYKRKLYRNTDLWGSYKCNHCILDSRGRFPTTEQALLTCFEFAHNILKIFACDGPDVNAQYIIIDVTDKFIKLNSIWK
jgi:hypothetical protein